ncbi:MAG: lipoyl(octanoyl) transferase LipB [Rhizobacter sp.]|nr:lipoyl(octanoyl) transferase LipB [Bacteriovorax sp.]
MIDLNQFENPEENIYILKKWNWDYLEAEKFQLACLDFVNANPHISLFIICSHPRCFTLGRGLQKLKEDIGVHLIDHDTEMNLEYPLYQIKRGGGLTFHYPGQVIFYPIVNLTYHKLAVHDFMVSILEAARLTLMEKFNLSDLKIRTDLLGLWFEENKKVASIGLANSRFTTYHGMALNFLKDESMFDALLSVFPCGLPGKTYYNIEDLTFSNLLPEDRESFSQSFISTLTRNFSRRSHFVEWSETNL